MRPVPLDFDLKFGGVAYGIVWEATYAEIHTFVANGYQPGYGMQIVGDPRGHSLRIVQFLPGREPLRFIAESLGEALINAGQLRELVEFFHETKAESDSHGE